VIGEGLVVSGTYGEEGLRARRSLLDGDHVTQAIAPSWLPAPRCWRDLGCLGCDETHDFSDVGCSHDQSGKYELIC
jgi:hypothetical protein